MNRWWVGGVVAVACIALAAAGCSSKKKGSELEGGRGGAAGLSRRSAWPGRQPRRWPSRASGSRRHRAAARHPFRLRFVRARRDRAPDAAGECRVVEGSFHACASRSKGTATIAARSSTTWRSVPSARRRRRTIWWRSGIGRDRITTISYGEELPLCQEETEECWARNRRAHFVPAGELSAMPSAAVGTRWRCSPRLGCRRRLRHAC